MNKINLSEKQFEKNAKEIQEIINKRNDFFFYFSSDFDSVCSSLSFALYLRRIGKNALIYFPQDKDKSSDFLFKIADYNKILIIFDLNDLIVELSSKEYVFAIFDTPNKSLLPDFDAINTIFNSYQNKESIEIDHHFGNDSEQIYPDSVSLFKNANSCCDIVADFLWICQTKSLPILSDTEDYFLRNIVLTLLTGICSDTQLGKFCPFSNERNWFEILTQRLDLLTWKNTDNLRTPNEIFEVITKVNKSKDLVFEKVMNNFKTKKGLGALVFPKVEKDENLLSEENLFCSLEDVSDDLVNLLPEKAGKVGIFAYFDSKKEKYMIKIRRSASFQGLDLRNLDKLIMDLFDNNFCGGGGHPGAVSFRVAGVMEYEEFQNKVETLFFQMSEKYFVN